jgi:hypothetical protein
VSPFSKVSVGVAGFSQSGFAWNSSDAFGHPMLHPWEYHWQAPPAQVGASKSMPPLLRVGGSYMLPCPSARKMKDARTKRTKWMQGLMLSIVESVMPDATSTTTREHKELYLLFNN